MIRKLKTRWLLTAASTLFYALPCWAAEVTFTVDPASFLDLQITVSGFPLGEQGPGSLSTTYFGTVTVDVDHVETPGEIEFVGSALQAANSGDWLPEPGGGPAPGNLGQAAPANYTGVFQATTALVVGDAYAAIRDIAVDVTTPGGPLAVTGGTSFASSQTFTLTVGWADFNYLGGLADPDGDASRSSLAGNQAMNGAAAGGTYARSGSTVTLTVPIDIDIPIMFDFGSGTANISGTAVATGDVTTADFNQDGARNGLDLLAWQRGANTVSGATLGDGDGNFDGVVGVSDLNLWQSEYATQPSGVASLRVVPEPAACVLIGTAIAAMLPTRRRSAGQFVN